MQKALALADALCIIGAMKTHGQIIKDVKGAKNIAVECRVSVHTVRSWITRDSIPAEHWAAFAGNGWASLEELAGAAASTRRAA